MKKYQMMAAATGLAMLWASTAQGVEVDAQLLLDLQQLVKQQQQQLDQQAAEIAKLKEAMAGRVTAAAQGGTQAEAPPPAADKLVTSSFEQVDVSIYGHVNKGVLYADPGDDQNVSFVDNGNSQSRIGVNASVVPHEDWKVGSKIEYGIKSNATTDVGQDATNNATSVTWNLRHADIFVQNGMFGKVSLGHGSTASDGSTEVDLSGTSVVAYSDVAALAGGQFWYDDASETRSELRVKNVFNNLDGLGRDDRLRYDTPSLAGLSLAGSAVSGEAFDLALQYSRDYGPMKVASALAWANTGENSTSIDSVYGGSLSILLANGLNATLAGGGREMKESGWDDPLFWYVKLGYRADFFSWGKTSFSADYGENENISASGDEAKSWALAAVQDLPGWGTEFYLAFRNYQLETLDSSYEEVNAVLGGARVKF